MLPLLVQKSFDALTQHVSSQQAETISRLFTLLKADAVHKGSKAGNTVSTVEPADSSTTSTTSTSSTATALTESTTEAGGL